VALRLCFIGLLLSSIFVWVGCEDDATPKERGYPRVIYPARAYQIYQESNAPFRFEFPKCCKVYPDTVFFGEKPENPWWLNVDYPQFNARIHISYKAIDQKNNSFKSLLEDAYQLSFKHSVKAEAIDRANINPAPHCGGQLFKIAGNAASSYQFFLTDSTHHFVRGALYFYCQPNADSLSPITQYIYTDLQHLIATFKWNK
jgi:gliding motility-associated lipoprotein GldD